MRIIVKVGRFPSEKGEGLMLAAKEEEISAISHFCSTVLRVAVFQSSLQTAIYTPIKDRP
ncbi:hypothetical protein [Pseudomonas sp. NPDC089534]|uniref:hypothetical protein n=1 Tax=Pseudomonas sp. NPDC089534 TaxID=3364468 RepID=UPI0037F8E739